MLEAQDSGPASSSLTSAGNEHCNRGKSPGRLDICQGEKTAGLAWCLQQQTDQAGEVPESMLPRSRWAPTGHIGPQGHLVVVDNSSRSRTPEIGSKTAVVHLGRAKSALEAMISFTGAVPSPTQPPPKGTQMQEGDSSTVCRPNLTCWMVGSPARFVRRLRMLRSDICRRAATGGMRDSMEGRRVTSAFMSLSNSSSWFKTAEWKGQGMES
jgi:hypothetical protein